MPTKLLVAASAAALAIGSPAAHADRPTYDCFYTAEEVGAISQTNEGMAVGYVVHALDPGAAIRCYITVDGTEVTSTPTGPGVTAGHVSFSASENSHVEMCAAVTTVHGTETSCDSGEPDSWEVVQDVIGGFCAAVAYFAGGYGPVTIDERGQIYLDGEPFFDCGPYYIWDPDA